ncbi:hypothetical protein HIM_00922 [Hirsutella minnesotensis 3608]|nr:hypothetical protein HIM_00922 [Hirsutella minnesotensis 3608]
MAARNFSPSSQASTMQLRTRREKHFEEFESTLPSPRTTSAPQTRRCFGTSSLWSWLGRWNPLGRTADDDDIVWLLDNTAFQSAPGQPWRAEFVTAVFEREDKGRLIDVVGGIARAVGLTDDARERRTVEERVLPFLWDPSAARTVNVAQRGRLLKLGPTDTDGLAANQHRVPSSPEGSLVKTSAKTRGGDGAITHMRTYFAGPDGWGVISDVDDTIKVTLTSDPVGILRESFVNPPSPIPGMPELYAEINDMLPDNTAWFYLTASPYNLYPFLKQFRRQFYPPGTLILRESSWKTIAGLLSALTLDTEEYKVDRMTKIHTWLPRRKMIVVGDSTQSDPEAYGEIYRTRPGWIKLILIRKVTDVAAVGIQEKNEPERFERAFWDIPRDAWHVFEDPRECVDIIKAAIARG